MKYKLIISHLEIEEGTILYEFHGRDYGCKRDDEELLGIPCKAFTKSEDGSGPFIIIPIQYVDVVE